MLQKQLCGCQKQQKLNLLRELCRKAEAESLARALPKSRILARAAQTIARYFENYILFAFLYCIGAALYRMLY